MLLRCTLPLGLHAFEREVWLHAVDAQNEALLPLGGYATMRVWLYLQFRAWFWGDRPKEAS